MRRLLAATLVLALTAGVPATASAQEPSEGESADGTEALQTPPRDAVILTVDADPYEAGIEEYYEVDWYRFEAREGQDYWIVADTRRGEPSEAIDAVVSLHDATGAEIEVMESSGFNARRWALLRDASASTYFVRVVGDVLGRVGLYGISVRAVNDDHGDTVAEATPVEPGTASEFVGRSDFEDDADWLVFDATAGEIYDIRSRGASFDLYRVVSDTEGPGDDSGHVNADADALTEWIGDRDRLRPWHVTESGRYAIRLRGWVDDQERPSDYSVTFERLEDDHANEPAEATPLGVFVRVAGRLDYSADEDWFVVHLLEGTRYAVEVLSADGDRPRAEITLRQDPFGGLFSSLQYVDWGSTQTGRLLWRARKTGEHFVQVSQAGQRRADHSPEDYVIRVILARLDDHPDGDENATSIVPGRWLEGVVDEPTDTDWFQVDLERGAVYQADYEELDEASGTYVARNRVYGSSGARPFFVGSDWMIDARRGLVLDESETVSLVVAGTSSRGTRYRLRLAAHEEEDYGDDRDGAAPVTMSDTVRGSVTDQDVDWFVFEAPARGIYSVEALTDEWRVFAVGVFDEDGPVPSLYGAEPYSRDASPFRGSELWRASAAGTYWIRVVGKWRHPFDYRLQFDYSAADDHGDSAEAATVLVLDPANVPAGVGNPDHLEGRPNASLGVPQVVVEGEIGKFVDEDWFALPVEAGVKYRITPYRPASAAPWSSDFERRGAVSVWDGVDRVAGWSGLRQPMEFVPAVAGTYHVQVLGVDEWAYSEPWIYGFEVAILEPDDVSDVRGGAEAISAGDTVESVLDTNGDVDWYRFEAVEGETWLLQAPVETWGCVELHGPGEDDMLHRQCGTGRHLWHVPEAGSYGIRVSVDWTPSLPSAYRFTLTVLDPDDHANHAGHAAVLVPGEVHTGLIDYEGDRDVFRLDVGADEMWKIVFARSDYWTRIGLEFVPDADDADSAGSWVGAGGFHYLRAPVDGKWLITFDGDWAYGDYTVTASRLEVQDDYGNSRREAHPIEAPEHPGPECASEGGAGDCAGGTAVAGRIDHALDVDYFRLSLTEGRAYEFSIDGAERLAVLAEASCVLRRSGVWEADATGDYWVRVVDRSWSRGGSSAEEFEPLGYMMRVTPVKPPAERPVVDPWETATRLEVGQIHEATFAESSPSHYYRVHLDHPHYVVEVDGDAQYRERSPNVYVERAQDGPRKLRALPRDPPVVWDFSVYGHGAYSVIVRERSLADNELEWFLPPPWHVESDGPDEPPRYCRGEPG